VSRQPRTIHPAGIFVAVAAALGLLACAKPIPPDALVKAEQAYGSAASDPEVSGNAPVYLYEAKKDLDRAQAAWKTDEEDPRVEHYAYLAHKRVEIARELAARRSADGQARELARERDQAVLEARSHQVDLAQIEAEQAREREAQAKAREEEARARAEEAALREQQAKAQAGAEAERAAALEKQLAALEARRTERGMVITLGDVLFDFGRAELRAGAQQNLYRLVTFLRENAEREVLIEGHTDSVGAEAYNLDLSRRRAEAVAGFLSQNGISTARTASMGYGEAPPVSSNETDTGRQQNRRVEIVVLNPS